MVGGVPARPSHYVAREDIVSYSKVVLKPSEVQIKHKEFMSNPYNFYFFQLSAIKVSLKALEPGHYVALHGMPVAGKSVLAAEAVRDPSITLQVIIIYSKTLS